MTPWAKHLLHKCKDLGLNPQSPHQIPGVVGHIRNPGTPTVRWEWRQLNPQKLEDQLAWNTQQERAKERPCLKQDRKQRPRPEVILQPPHVCCGKPAPVAFEKQEIKILTSARASLLFRTNQGIPSNACFLAHVLKFPPAPILTHFLPAPLQPGDPTVHAHGCAHPQMHKVNK